MLSGLGGDAHAGSVVRALLAFKDAGNLTELTTDLDDHLARGALAALSYAGLKAPDDILVATWANAGLGPDYPRELSRMEFDPALAGREVARRVVECLRTGIYPSGGVVGPRWIPGETIGGPA